MTQTFTVSRGDQSAAHKAAETAQERGEEFLTAFDACLTGLGYGYTGAPCQCEDPDNGHEPACGWSKVD